MQSCWAIVDAAIFAIKASRIVANRTHNPIPPIPCTAASRVKTLHNLITPLVIMTENSAEPDCPNPELVRTHIASVPAPPSVPVHAALTVAQVDV